MFNHHGERVERKKERWKGEKGTKTINGVFKQTESFQMTATVHHVTIEKLQKQSL